MLRILKKRVKLPPVPESPVYDNCTVLTLDRFERCLLNEDLQALVKEGRTADEQLLKDTWQKIWTEYVDLSGDKDFINYRGKRAEELQRSIKIERIEETVKVLWSFYYPPLIQQLREWGYTVGEYPLDPHQVEQYRRELDMIAASLGHDEARLEQLKKEMRNYQARNSGSISTGYFDRLLAEIEEMQGMMIDKSLLSVKKFVVYLDKLRDKYKAMNLKNNKHG